MMIICELEEKAMVTEKTPTEVEDSRTGASEKGEAPVRLLLADDHIMFINMLRDVLSRKEGYVIVGEATDGLTTLNQTARYHPDLLLLDCVMPGIDRLCTFCEKITRLSPSTRILIVSGHAEEEVGLEAAVGGAQGYILKAAPLPDLFSAIRTICAGGVWIDPHLPPQVFHAFLRHRKMGANDMSKLSRQELLILSLVAQDMNNKEISAHLHIDERTVKNHLTHIFAKLGVTCRREAALYFLGGKRRESDEEEAGVFGHAKR
jgi:DNA-binding NarL/FixJ family response regulator